MQLQLKVLTAQQCLQVKVKTSLWSSSRARVEAMSGATLPPRGRILLNRVTWHLPSITITTTTRMSTKSRRCLSHAPRPPEVRAVLWGAIMERREGKRLAHICSFHQETSLFYFPGRRPCGIQRNWKPHVWNREQGPTLQMFSQLLNPFFRMGKIPTSCCPRT